jgi:molybdate transport system permease protein
MTEALIVTLKVTGLATLIIAVFGTLLALLLARARFPGRTLLELLLALPLVLPPTVVGFFLLYILGRGSPLHDWLGLELLFTWQGAAVAASVVGLPLMLQSARAAIAAVDPELEDAARTLGRSEPEVLLRVTLPLAHRGILSGLFLGSARALGEFGATLMVAGNIPGRTRTLPMVVYDAALGGDLALAAQTSALLSGIAFLALALTRRLEQPARR